MAFAATSHMTGNRRHAGGTIKMGNCHQHTSHTVQPHMTSHPATPIAQVARVCIVCVLDQGTAWQLIVIWPCAGLGLGAMG